MSRTPQEIIEDFIKATDIAGRTESSVTLYYQEAAVIASWLAGARAACEALYEKLDRQKGETNEQRTVHD